MFRGKNEKTPDLEFFTVYDSKSQSYAEPFPAPNKDVLLRDFLNAFRKAASDPNSQNKYYLNAEDYSVFNIGSFDLKTGLITPKNADHVVNLHDIRAMARPETAKGALSST